MQTIVSDGQESMHALCYHIVLFFKKLYHHFIAVTVHCMPDDEKEQKS